MVNRFEIYFVACYAYFTAKLHQFEKREGYLKIWCLYNMSTRENVRLITRTALMFFPDHLTHLPQFKTFRSLIVEIVTF